jgi:Fungal chitosanase of glycosyl hydrolase group 75
MTPTLKRRIGYSCVYDLHDGSFIYTSGLAIDADGSPHAYGPHGLGLDWLANAGRPGDWWGIVTDRHGDPVIQGPDDPAPHYYVSTTSLEDTTQHEASPLRYVDSETVPFIVLPSDNRFGCELGDNAFVFHPANGASSFAIFADIGPVGHLGEGSIKLAQNLQINHDPKHGGCAHGIWTVLFPGSKDKEQVKLVEEWGGIDRIRSLAKMLSE